MTCDMMNEFWEEFRNGMESSKEEESPEKTLLDKIEQYLDQAYDKGYADATAHEYEEGWKSGYSKGWEAGFKSGWSDCYITLKKVSNDD